MGKEVVLLLDCSEQMRERIEALGHDVKVGRTGFADGIRELPCHPYNTDVIIYDLRDPIKYDSNAYRINDDGVFRIMLQSSEGPDGEPAEILEPLEIDKPFWQAIGTHPKEHGDIIRVKVPVKLPSVTHEGKQRPVISPRILPPTRLAKWPRYMPFRENMIENRTPRRRLRASTTALRPDRVCVCFINECYLDLLEVAEVVHKWAFRGVDFRRGSDEQLNEYRWRLSEVFLPIFSRLSVVESAAMVMKGDALFPIVANGNGEMRAAVLLPSRPNALFGWIVLLPQFKSNEEAAGIFMDECLSELRPLWDELRGQAQERRESDAPPQFELAGPLSAARADKKKAAVSTGTSAAESQQAESELSEDDARTARAPVTPDGNWTQLQLCILEALHYCSRTGENLANAVGRKYPTVRDALRTNGPLRTSGYVTNKRGLGYYRTDAPPDFEAEHTPTEPP